jgi:hypothetical protein
LVYSLSGSGKKGMLKKAVTDNEIILSLKAGEGLIVVVQN